MTSQIESWYKLTVSTIQERYKKNAEYYSGVYWEDTIITINRKKTIKKENEEERPIFQTLFIAGCLKKTANIWFFF